MSTETWGQMPKNMEDPEKIEEAIARLLTAHKEDPEAHMATGESLKVHRSQESVDHPLGKLRSNAAIARRRDYNLLQTTFESLDHWGINDSGQPNSVFGLLGEVSIETGATIDNYVDLSTESYLNRSPVKDSFFETAVSFQSISNSETYIGYFSYFFENEEDRSGYGFKTIGEDLYAVILHSDGYDYLEKAVKVATIPYLADHVLAAEHYAGDKIIFSVDGVDVYTEETTFPILSWATIFTYNLKTLESSNKYIRIRYLSIGHKL